MKGGRQCFSGHRLFQDEFGELDLFVADRHLRRDDRRRNDDNGG